MKNFKIITKSFKGTEEKIYIQFSGHAYKGFYEASLKRGNNQNSRPI